MNRMFCYLVLAGAGLAPPALAADPIANLPCDELKTETWPDGVEVTRCVLHRPAEISGVRYRDTVWVAAEGAVRYGRLERDTTIQGALLPGASWVARDRAGTIEHVFLPDLTWLEGHPCRGGGHSYMTKFHPNGRLALCWLDEDQEIDGVPCKDAGFWFIGDTPVEFTHEGKLAACTLSKSWTRDGVVHRRGVRITLTR